MPCDAGPSKQDQQDVDTMARLACMFCEFLDTEGEPIPEWAEDWWERHQEYDRTREERDQAERIRGRQRQAALDKLTPQERELLGL